MSLNQCNFLGNMGSDPDLRYMPDGRVVVNFTIACGEKWKDKVSGEIKEHTEWIRAVCFGKRAEVIAQYHKKGSQIQFTGKMRTRSYEKDGVKHYTTEIVVDNFNFCGGQKTGSGDEKAKQQAASYSHGPGAASKSGIENNVNQAASYMPGNYADFDDDIPFASLNAQIRGHLI